MKKISYLAKRLGEMRPGDRSWFWYSPDSEELPLLIEKFSNPKGHEQLARLASKLMLPSGSRVCTGIVMVSSSGTLQ